MSFEAELEEVYSLIPEVKCKGLCYPACALIPLTEIELSLLPPTKTVRLEDIKLAGVGVGLMLMPVLDERRRPRCPFLKDNRCSVHPKRPGICRLYGASEDPRMVCEYDCETVGPKLSREAGRDVMGMILELNRRAQQGAG